MTLYLEDPSLRPLPPEHHPEAVAKVAQILSALDETDREIVQLRANGLKHREIGAILWPEMSEGHSTGKSERRWRYLRARLRGEPTPHRGSTYVRTNHWKRMTKQDPFYLTVRAAVNSLENQ